MEILVILILLVLLIVVIFMVTSGGTDETKPDGPYADRYKGLPRWWV